ncbi:MAG: aminotransferase class III-fold pyridoxal phosphate-dependent enzyme [Spirochaetia bacterium]|nr:aminotransferase class III-fold pyridoxal phosphate-dependent enzyme [Spirochaetia bacterium]
MSNRPGYAIQEYHDTQKVMDQLNALIRQPIRGIKKEAMDKYLEYYETKCQKSKAMIQEAMNYIPGGVQHNLAFNYPFPLVFTKAEGAYLYDIDGNRYIDFLQAGGPTVLGSNPPKIREKVKELLDTCGPATGLFHEYELKLAKLVCDTYPGVEFFRALNSGTEACMAAARIARCATGHKNIVKMGGAYHGWSDQLSYGLRVPGRRSFGSHGIPKNIFKYTQEFFPNDIKSLKRVLRRNVLRGGTAAVYMEPVGPESGTRPLDYDFPKKVQALCKKYGALLIFDEVVTGFRLGPDGAQGYFGIVPDLTIFGKVIAGGYPSAGAIAGLNKWRPYLAGGLDTKKEGEKKVHKAHVGGTLAANPLSSLAGYYTVKEIIDSNACEKAGAMGDRLTKGLQELIKKYNLPFVAYNQGSICHLETVGTMLFSISLLKFWKIPGVLKETTRRQKMMQKMGAAYMAEGIVTLAGSRMYTSAADTEEIIDDALARFERVFKNIAEGEE